MLEVRGLTKRYGAFLAVDRVDFEVRRGESDDPIAYKRRIGYVPEEPHLYTHLSATEYLMLVGRRRGLREPMEHRANWIFRLTEDDATRSEQMRAVDRVVTVCLVGLPVALAVPLLWIALGSRSLTAVVIVALIGLIFVHAVLFDWRRIPFGDFWQSWQFWQFTAAL